jgi:uncharacterized coiled-coil protein SlyX
MTTTAKELEARLAGIERAVNQGKSEIKKFNSTVYELDKKVAKGLNDIVVVKKDVKGLNKKVIEGTNEIVKFRRKLTTTEKALKGIKKIASDAKKLGETAKGFIKKAGPLLKLVDVADSLFNLALQSALIILIADRFDAMDQLVDSHATALSQNLGFLQRHEKRLDTLEPKVKNLNDIAAEARSNASKALVGLEALEPKVDNLNDIAAQANSNASKGLNKVEALEPKVKSLNDSAAQANSNASKALNKVEVLEPKVKSLNDSAAQANSNASKALNKVEVLEPKVKSLNDSAAQANSNASKALTGISSIETKLKQLNDLTAQANSNASKALQKAPVPGPAGPAGKPGKDGAPGKDGKQGIAGVTGPAGIPGSAGATGATGPAGAPGAIGKTGATGAPGVAGAPGRQGVPGIAGAPGKQGVPGKDGAPGKQGVPGKDGAPGKQGAPGVAGAPGKDGAPGRDGIDGKDAEDVDLSGIEAKLEEISNLVISIPGLITKLPAQESFKAGVAEGTCRTTQPGGCMAKRFDNLDGLGNASNTKLDGVNATLEAAQLHQVGVINAKLGPAIPGGIGANVFKTFEGVKNLTDKLWKTFGIDRVVSLLTLAASIHNAAMLSRQLGETLVETAETIIKAMQATLPDFLKNPDGENLEIDLSELFTNQIEDFLKNTLGEDNFYELKATWIKNNRILTAASNGLSAMRGMSNAMTDGLQVVGGWIAQGFNGIQREGLVSDKTWPWMDEAPRFKNKELNRFTNLLENAEDATSSVQQIGSQVIEFTQESKELVEATTALNKALDEDTEKIAAEEKKKDEESEAKEPSDSDLLPSK